MTVTRLPHANVADPKKWRDRAEECRIHAGQMADIQAMQILLRCSDDYERWAMRDERLLAEQRKKMTSCA